MPLDGTLSIAAESGRVDFVFTVTNAGAEPVDLQFPSGKVTDVAVSDREREVWRWSEDRMFTQALQTETLAPADSLTHEVTWADPPAGTYTATATLEATNATVEAGARFDV